MQPANVISDPKTYLSQSRTKGFLEKEHAFSEDRVAQDESF
jgi:hypothetical protein